MTDDPKAAVVRGYMAAIDRHDRAALAAHPGLHELVLHIPLLWTALPDLRHTITQQMVDGELVATCATMAGTHRGPLFGVAPTGRELSCLVLAVDQVVDGQVVLHYGLPDWLALLLPLGVLPAPAPA